MKCVCLIGVCSILLIGVTSGCATAQPATFKMVEASPGVSFEQGWLAVVEAVGDRLDIETVDKESGYLRTAWKQSQKFLSSSYRTRCVASVASRQPFKVKIKVEREKYDSLSEKWIAAGNDEEMEREILADINGRLQRR